MQNKQMLFDQLRKDYPQCLYKAYGYTETDMSLDIVYHFEIPGLGVFQPTWSITKLTPRFFGSDDPTLDELVFSLGMAELVSYWKVTCAPDIRVDAKVLSSAQTDWWVKLYTKGLGEFFYTNGIATGDGLMTIQSAMAPSTAPPAAQPVIESLSQPPTVLVPIGGGKDSVVTLELLRHETERFGYIINPREATLGTAQAAGVADRTVIAKRRLDAQLLAYNAQGFLNGHTPFSAIVAFSSLIAAYLHRIPYVALSNESSANEPTVTGTDVNHQYSKSVEFEKDFMDYEAAFIRSGVRYFSLLRPLNELRIARLFSQYPAYFPIFRSCNAGSKTDSWCGACPKCLFVYIILSPFITRENLCGLFHKDLLADTGLTDMLDKLTGLQPEKPFECVGQRDEVHAALHLTAQKYSGESQPYPPLLDYFLRHFPQEAENDSTGTPLLAYFDNNHRLPPFFLSLLRHRLAATR